MAPTEEDVAQDSEVLIDDGGEEAEPIKHAADPGRPTAKQVADHRKAHIPYRSWCKWCVLGRGRGFQHRKSDKSFIPIIGLDYFFLTKGGVKTRKELDFSIDEEGDKRLEAARTSGDVVKCLLVRCSLTKAVFAHVVQQKGVDENDIVSDTVLADLEWLGHRRVILKADGEPAMQALVKRVLELAKIECTEMDQLSQEQPAAYDSQSNGGTEVGVRLVRGMLRTVKQYLEERLNRYIPVDHGIIPWMLEHVCLLLNVLVRGEDGLTAWQRVRGRAFGQQLLGFGESVLYRHPGKGPHHQPDGNVGALGGEGVFLGYNRNANTFRIGVGDKIVAARSMTRRDEEHRWNPEALARIREIPGTGHRPRERSQVSFNARATETGPTTDGVRLTPFRRLRINMSDLRTYGFLESCPQCRCIQRHNKARPGGAHSDACRSRIIECMKQTDEGRARLELQDERAQQQWEEHAEAVTRRDNAASEQVQTEVRRPRGFLERVPEEGAPEATANPATASTSSDMTRPLRVPNREVDNSSRERSRVPADEAAMPKPRVRGAAPPARARVEMQSRDDVQEDAWRDIPGGDVAAPSTPTHNPDGDGGGAHPPRGDHESEPMGGDDDAMGQDVYNPDVEMDFIGNMELVDDLGKLEPRFDDELSCLLLNQLGSVGRSYRREARQAARHIVSEVYSPPRVTAMINGSKLRHVMPGYALDLTVTDPADGLPWDFSLEHKRIRARRLLREQKPYLLIGSPECKQFCTWQAINKARYGENETKRALRVAAEVHMKFVAELYQDQLDGGRYFLHEHPRWATSWSLEVIENIRRQPSVVLVQSDQCQYGAESKTSDGGGEKGSPIMKPTGFMTNSSSLAKALSRRCTGVGGRCSRPKGGRHRLCNGRHASMAQQYPKGLCQAILRGIRDQLREDHLIKDGCFGVQVPDDDAAVEATLKSAENGYTGRFRDDLTGQVLRDELVLEARAKELSFFCSKSVWLKEPKAQARAKSGRPPISVRWVDVNKGDDQSPNYRSRLVARQIKAQDLSGKNYFAPAPPLEALRTVVSLAMTRVGGHQPVWDPQDPQRAQISRIDVKRAYFNAKVDPEEPPTYVQLPPEDPDSGTMVARLLRHMYGTRMAADGWQEEYSTCLVDLGFTQGDACPNLFYHQARKIVTSVRPHSTGSNTHLPKSTSLRWNRDWDPGRKTQKREESSTGS